MQLIGIVTDDQPQRHMGHGRHYVAQKEGMLVGSVNLRALMMRQMSQRFEGRDPLHDCDIAVDEVELPGSN